MGDYVLNPGPGQLNAIGLQANGRVIANFAWQHMKAATIFRDQVVFLESKHLNEPFGTFFEEIRSYASACLMSSAAFLEAWINELFIAHDGELRLQFKDFEEEFWGGRGIERKSILDKYIVALKMLSGLTLDEHSQIFRDAWALIELRNALVHYKPTWDPDRKRKIELTEVLDGRFPHSPFPDAGADFVTMKCMGSGCAIWSVMTSLAFMYEFYKKTNLDPIKLNNFRQFENL